MVTVRALPSLRKLRYQKDMLTLASDVSYEGLEWIGFFDPFNFFLVHLIFFCHLFSFKHKLQMSLRWFLKRTLVWYHLIAPALASIVKSELRDKGSIKIELPLLRLHERPWRMGEEVRLYVDFKNSIQKYHHVDARKRAKEKAHLDYTSYSPRPTMALVSENCTVYFQLQRSRSMSLLSCLPRRLKRIGAPHVVTLPCPCSAMQGYSFNYTFPRDLSRWKGEHDYTFSVRIGDPDAVPEETDRFTLDPPFRPSK